MNICDQQSGFSSSLWVPGCENQLVIVICPIFVSHFAQNLNVSLIALVEKLGDH